MLRRIGGPDARRAGTSMWFGRTIWPALARSIGGDVRSRPSARRGVRRGRTRPSGRRLSRWSSGFARAAHESGVRHDDRSLLGRARIANVARSSTSRLKGEVEQALAALAFDRLDIVRPGLLRGGARPDRRLKERIAIAVSPVVNLLLRGRLDPLCRAIERLGRPSARNRDGGALIGARVPRAGSSHPQSRSVRTGLRRVAPRRLQIRRAHRLEPRLPVALDGP